MKLRNMFRLTINLANVEHKKDFKNTFTYKNVMTEHEAINLIWNMHAEVTDTSITLARKITKVTYNGKPLEVFTRTKEFNNGWIVKNNA